jgi:hypothetical protein
MVGAGGWCGPQAQPRTRPPAPTTRIARRLPIDRPDQGCWADLANRKDRRAGVSAGPSPRRSPDLASDPLDPDTCRDLHRIFCASDRHPQGGDGASDPTMPGCVMAGSSRQSGRPPRREGLMSWLRFRPALLDGTRARPRPSAGGRIRILDRKGPTAPQSAGAWGTHLQDALSTRTDLQCLGQLKGRS